MFTVPQEVSGIYHPFIEHMYIKDTSNENHKGGKTLIIETLKSESGDDHTSDILADLDDLRCQVQANASKFDEIEIRSR